MKIVELFNGLKIVTYETEDFISNSIYKHMCWEPNVTDTFINILKNSNSPIVLDVGCNIGYFSIISSLYSKQVFSFDANINNLNLLNESIGINDIKNIKTIHSCVSDNNKCFYKISNNYTTNIGALRVEECKKEESNLNTIVIDDFIEKNNIKEITIIKIDIEGGELKCLYGLKKSLEKKIINNIIIEITPLWGISEAESIINILNEHFDLYNIGLIEDSKYDSFYDDILKKRIFSLNDISNDYEKNVQTNILGIKK
jgi:FkbM family methyltransferase